jgi:probable RcsB/C two-component-system connector, global regulator of biofilm formation and acid-resistance
MNQGLPERKQAAKLKDQTVNVMQQPQMTDASAISSCLNALDERYEDEKRVFCAAVRKSLEDSGQVSRMAIIFCITGEMKATTDPVRLDILRSCLEILVGMNHTPDTL